MGPSFPPSLLSRGTCRFMGITAITWHVPPSYTTNGNYSGGAIKISIKDEGLLGEEGTPQAITVKLVSGVSGLEVGRWSFWGHVTLPANPKP